MFDIKHKKLIILLFLVPMAILGVGLTIYLMTFHNNLSNNSDNWGDFGSYFSSILSIANIYVFVIFSWLIYKYNDAKDSEFKNFQQSIENPILTFKTIIVAKQEVWQIVNIGHGAALNLQVSHKSNITENWDGKLVNCYSLGKGDYVNLDWITVPDIIGVHYKDIFSNQFITIVCDDVIEVKKFDSNFDKIEINQKIIAKSDIQKMLSLEKIRITSIRNINTTTTTTETTRREG